MFTMVTMTRIYTLANQVLTLYHVLSSHFCLFLQKSSLLDTPPSWKYGILQVVIFSPSFLHQLVSALY